MIPDEPARQPGRGGANVLVTAAGRRTGLVRAFLEAVHERGGRVYAADVDGLAPALYLADEAIRSLRSDDASYIDDLLASVARHGIRLLVPTIDTDLPILARHAGSFDAAGCRVAISMPAFIEMTMDKHLSGLAFEAAGVRVARSWIPPLPPAAAMPAQIFVKPRAGSASQDTYRIDLAELDGVLRLVRDPIVQEVLTGPEITIDALLDLDGLPIHYVPRRRIRTLGGESIQGVTLEHDPAFETWIEAVLAICADMGARGPLTLQAFVGTGGPVLSEVNARFGGGFPLALEAGGTYPRWLLDMVEGVAVRPRLREYETGVFMTRANAERFVREPKW
jgi:carbamoyl-phosphate synthase large subunit